MSDNAAGDAVLAEAITKRKVATSHTRLIAACLAVGLMLSWWDRLVGWWNAPPDLGPFATAIITAIDKDDWQIEDSDYQVEKVMVNSKSLKLIVGCRPFADARLAVVVDSKDHTKLLTSKEIKYIIKIATKKHDRLSIIKGEELGKRI